MTLAPTEILVIGTNADILKTIGRLIEKNEAWRATIVNSVAEATSICLKKSIDLILIGAGITENDEKELRKKLKKQNTPIVNHYGGGSGLLYAEIYQALAN